MKKTSRSSSQNSKDSRNPSETENDFEKIGLKSFLQEKLKERDISTLFEVQKAVFKKIVSKKNVIVSALTGSGKTLAFILPLVQQHYEAERFTHDNPTILVMAPTRELAIQIAKEFDSVKSSKCKVKTVLVYGGVSLDDQKYQLRDGCDVVVGTPGRIKDMIERNELKLKNIRTVVLDEADKMLQMGFQEEVQIILDKINEVSKKIQMCLFSATLPHWVKSLFEKMVGSDYEHIDLVKDLSNKTPKLSRHLKVCCVNSERVTTMADLILCYGGKMKSTIVFVDTKRDCNNLMISDKIKQEVQIIHGDINQKQREATIQAFKNGKFKCLVATDVASRGLDIPHVDLVIQSHPPKEIDSYIHRAGRTARAGRSGMCITLYSRNEEGLISRIESQAKIKMEKVGAPQAADLIGASTRDVSDNLSSIDESAIKMFQPSAKALIEQYGAEEAVARILALSSGHHEGIKHRSILNGAEGFVSFLITTDKEANSNGYFWGILRKSIPEEMNEQIRGMKIIKNKRGAIFDVPEKHAKEFENAVKREKYYGRGYELVIPTELPDMADEGSGNYRQGGSSGYSGGGYSNGGSYSNGNSSSRNRFDRENTGGRSKLELFIGGIPSGCSDEEMEDFIIQEGAKQGSFQFRHVLDKETNESKGFGFATCYSEDTYNTLLKANGRRLKGRPLRINDAGSKPNK